MNILNIKHSLSLLMFSFYYFLGVLLRLTVWNMLWSLREKTGENWRKCWNIIVMTALNFVQHVS